MFSAFKKLTRTNEDRCAAPVPMSSSLQKKFSKGVHFNMKILIKGDRNVGKTCLLQRLQGGPFIEDYVPTDQIQVAPIHWTYKETDHIVKVEVWEVVDKGRTKKKQPLGLKLENQSFPTEEGYETPVLDATFLDVYKNACGVILMLDITKPWSETEYYESRKRATQNIASAFVSEEEETEEDEVLCPPPKKEKKKETKKAVKEKKASDTKKKAQRTFDYVVKELSQIPADLPVIILGNHCDMQHHRQVHSHHIEQALSHAKLTRTAPTRYAESSMRNGFGLRLLHKFLSVPFLKLQRTSLLEQLQRNRKDTEDIEKELDEFQNSEESQYNIFLDRLVNKRRQGNDQSEVKLADRSPSIVIGAGKPIIPQNVNPLLAQSLNPLGIKAQHSLPQQLTASQGQHCGADEQPAKPTNESKPNTPSEINTASTGDIDEFYAGALDNSFLEDLTPLPNNQEYKYQSDSDDENTTNPRVNVDQDDLDIELSTTQGVVETSVPDFSDMRDRFTNQMIIRENMLNQEEREKIENLDYVDHDRRSQLSADKDFPLWAGDASVRRSPEGGEDPDLSNEPDSKTDKKHKKKKSKDKDRGDYSDKSERKDKKHKHKKTKTEKHSLNPQQALLAPTPAASFNYEEYDTL